VLASQQAIVRRAYERSIEELSASPSLADQVIARSLEKFISTMPAPEANSARAARLGDVGADPHVRSLALSRSGSEVDTLDPLSAALARSRDMRAGIRSGKPRPRQMIQTRRIVSATPDPILKGCGL
jgi:hypothetical protein